MGDRNQKPKNFKKRGLKEYDGMEGRPSYVAYKGKVYDLSDSRLWKGGRHQERHLAGDNLTEHMVNAPHGEEVLMKFPIVGELSIEEPFRHRTVERIERLHLHPIAVHFSIAYAILVSLLSFLYMFTGAVCFETASYYLLALGFISTPASGLSGLFSWKVSYEGRMTRIFFWKMLFTIILVVVITLSVVVRTVIPNILLAKTGLSYIYLALVTSLVPVAATLGYYGGKIVYS